MHIFKFVSTVLLLGAVSAVPGRGSDSDSDLRTTRSGRCGERFGTCTGSDIGSCCSKYGYCGDSKEYCSKGCQGKFGSCWDSPSNPHNPVSKDGRCGKVNGKTCLGSEDGDCCSVYNYCGKTSAYCGKGCQPLYGNCFSPSSSKTSSTKSGASVSRSSTSRTSTRSPITRTIISRSTGSASSSSSSKFSSTSILPSSISVSTVTSAVTSLTSSSSDVPPSTVTSSMDSSSTASASSDSSSSATFLPSLSATDSSTTVTSSSSTSSNVASSSASSSSDSSSISTSSTARSTIDSSSSATSTTSSSSSEVSSSATSSSATSSSDSSTGSITMSSTASSTVSISSSSSSSATPSLCPYTTVQSCTPFAGPAAAKSCQNNFTNNNGCSDGYQAKCGQVPGLDSVFIIESSGGIDNTHTLLSTAEDCANRCSIQSACVGFTFEAQIADGDVILTCRFYSRIGSLTSVTNGVSTYLRLCPDTTFAS